MCYVVCLYGPCPAKKLCSHLLPCVLGIRSLDHRRMPLYLPVWQPCPVGTSLRRRHPHRRQLLHPSTLRARFVADISKRFPTEDKGELEWILNTAITRDRAARTLSLSQALFYVADLVSPSSAPTSTGPAHVASTRLWKRGSNFTLGKPADFPPAKSSRPRNTLRARSKASQGRSMT